MRSVTSLHLRLNSKIKVLLNKGLVKLIFGALRLQCFICFSFEWPYFMTFNWPNVNFLVSNLTIVLNLKSNPNFKANTCFEGNFCPYRLKEWKNTAYGQHLAPSYMCFIRQKTVNTVKNVQNRQKRSKPSNTVKRNGQKR